MASFNSKYTFDTGCKIDTTIEVQSAAGKSYVAIKVTNAVYEEGVTERGVYEDNEVVIQLPVEIAKALMNQLKELSNIE